MNTPQQRTYDTRKAGRERSSPDSVAATAVMIPEERVTLDLLKRQCGKKLDPIIKVYPPQGLTADQRNFLLRSFMYFSPFTEKAGDDFEAADNALPLGPIFNDTYHHEHPLALKYSGARALWRYLNYVQSRKNAYWPAGDMTVKLYLAVLPGNTYYPIV